MKLYTKWKRALLVFSMISCLMVVAACGSDKDDSASSPSPSASAPASVAPSSSPSPSPTQAADPVELTISAAASLNESLTEIQKLYAAKAPHVTLVYNFGASGTLQQQIEQGAPADLFISAGTKQMTALVDKDLIDGATKKTLLLNDLVLVVPADGSVNVTKIEDLSNAEIKQLAVGIPESVPAGSYAKEALTYFSLWDSLQPKIVQAKDVKQVLSYVETGNAEAGFVYKSDAVSSTGAKIAFTVDPASHKAIEYPMGIIKDTKNLKEVQAFYDYLQTKEALDVFVKYGFTLPQ